MGRFIQLVMGPAGVGKSSYCKTIQEHGRANKRIIHVANLDPACDTYDYDAAFDIKDLIDIDTVMEDQGYGPNGGLIYCMEFLVRNLDWYDKTVYKLCITFNNISTTILFITSSNCVNYLCRLKDALDEFGEDEYILLDCPGQVELYSHLPVMHNIAKALESWGYRTVGVYLLDALFVLEPSKFISGCLLSLSCMLQLELPHINVITKCDIADKERVASILDCEGSSAITRLFDATTNNVKMKNLTRAMGSVIDDYMLVSFVMLDVSDEETIEEVMLRTDHCVQYGE